MITDSNWKNVGPGMHRDEARQIEIRRHSTVQGFEWVATSTADAGKPTWLTTRSTLIQAKWDCDGGRYCTNCDSTLLEWGWMPKNTSGVVNGRLAVSDVTLVFYLACQECSETLLNLSPDEVLGLLDQLKEF